MNSALRNALFNSLSLELGSGQREVVIFLLQRDYDIRFIGGKSHTLQEIENALRDILRADAQRVIARMNRELCMGPVES